MSGKDWIVTDDGHCESRPTCREWDLIRDKYYFHEFLTEIITLLRNVPNEADEWDYLPQIRMRVRQLTINSYWLHTQYPKPCSKTGIGTRTLYDEIGYPLTVQTAAFAPGVSSNIHNHGTWGVVAVLMGQEKHTFWQRVPDPQFPHKIEVVGEKVLSAGEIISFMPNAIHQVTAIGDAPAFSFTLYGDTQPRSRFIFDVTHHTAKPF
ncbi:cupin [Tumidithrix helvetica]|uniref:cupin n=1 Tax=Tumidithrix helvetica TaxID=3457545 RepID=UPI003CC587A4